MTAIDLQSMIVSFLEEHKPLPVDQEQITQTLGRAKWFINQLWRSNPQSTRLTEPVLLQRLIILADQLDFLLLLIDRRCKKERHTLEVFIRSERFVFHSLEAAVQRYRENLKKANNPRQREQLELCLQTTENRLADLISNRMAQREDQQLGKPKV